MSTALVLIDLQQGLFAQGHPALESIAERLNRLIASASVGVSANFFMMISTCRLWISFTEAEDSTSDR